MTKVDTDLVRKARAFAVERHATQVRKYTGEPYAIHLEEVATFCEMVDADETIVAAAWLHDIVEDQDVTREDLVERFGEAVASLVMMVTDVSRPEDGNREVRKAVDREHLSKASPAGKTIKLADLLSNTRSIVDHDPSFAKVYLREKALLLPLLEEGDPVLKALADGLLMESMTKLEKYDEVRSPL